MTPPLDVACFYLTLDLIKWCCQNPSESNIPFSLLFSYTDLSPFCLVCLEFQQLMDLCLHPAYTAANLNDIIILVMFGSTI